MIATVWPEMVEGVGYTVAWVDGDVLSIDKREVDRALQQQPLDVTGLDISDVVGFLLSDIDPDNDHAERVAASRLLAGLSGGGLVDQLQSIGDVTPNWNMLNAKQVALLLGVSEKTIYRQVRSGDIIDCRWIGNKLLFLFPDDVAAILEKAKPTHPEHPAYLSEEAKLLRATGPR